MSQPLAVKYRPKTFDDVVEQSVTTEILKKQIETNTFKNAYLFAGASGCGKTTCARIFANMLNKGLGDPIEVDGASNNGVDNVRTLSEAAVQRSLVGEYKVMIVDECHAITTQGWQAFLKTIEDCPKYTIFIFCTTEPQKLPVTILNRLQRYNFVPISASGIKKRLEQICQAEGFINYEDTCELLSHIAQGGLRDALTYLDQCADFSYDLSLNNTKKVIGDFSYEVMLKFSNYIIDGNSAEVLKIIDSLSSSGKDLKAFINNYLDFAIDLVKYILYKDITITNLPSYLENVPENNCNIKYTVSFEGAIKFFNLLTDLLLDIKFAIRNDSSYKTTIEAKLLKFCRRG